MKMGVEQEFVFRDRSGRYLDCGNSDYQLFSRVVEQFPFHEGDEAWFDCKSLETRPKRCYVEGFEHHGPDGRLLETLPKGLEIRTLPHQAVQAVIDEFRKSYARVMDLAGREGLYPVLTSRHPFQPADAVIVPLDPVEETVRTAPQLALAIRAMMAHGMHLTVSIPGHSRARMEDLLRKVNHYVPFLIPYSFSSPFYEGRAFEGLCSRNYYRAGTRQMASLETRKGGLVLEFRGFDACGDAELLAALLTLFEGFVTDESLPGRSSAQDPELLQRTSMLGFDDEFIEQQGLQVLNAARAALPEGAVSLDLLEDMLRGRDSYAARMKRQYMQGADLMTCISNRYDY